MSIFSEEWRNWLRFWEDQYDLFSEIVTSIFGWSTLIKKLVTSLMYRQQGKFSGTFVHLSMVVLTILAIVLSSRVEAVLALRGSVRREYDNQFVVQGGENLGVETQISDQIKGDVTEYRVKEGDSLASIAKTFGVSMDTIIWENNLKNSEAIKPKQLLRILPETGVRHRVARGETIYSVAKYYGVDAQAIADYPFNTFSNDETFALVLGQELFIPDGVKPNSLAVDSPRLVTIEVPPRPGVKGEGNFIWPSWGHISQKYSWYHTGIDLANHDNPPVSASQGGTVVKAGWNAGGYGNYVVIDHGNGYKTLYAHMLNGSLLVKAGDVVKQGQRIGTMGSTGRSTGTHLHFEVFKDGKRTDPFGALPRL